MDADCIRVRARLRLLATSEGGRVAPIQGSYRPLHNFFDTDCRELVGGSIHLPDGTLLHPGQVLELVIAVNAFDGLGRQIYPGRERRIQEGSKLVGFGTVLEVLTAD